LLTLFIAENLAQPRSKYQFAIVTKGGDLIGSCGIRLEADQQASVGCELGREWQKKGYALEAGSAMLAFGFEQQGVHRIYAETISENKAAIRLCKILGMRHEALFLENRYFQNRWGSTCVGLETTLLVHRCRVVTVPATSMSVQPGFAARTQAGNPRID
jgi:RimJ/RimL family protein N-acetyltransferase